MHVCKRSTALHRLEVPRDPSCPVPASGRIDGLRLLWTLSKGSYGREVRSVYCEEMIGSLPPRLKLHYSVLPSLSIFCITLGGEVFCVWFFLWAYLSGAVLRQRRAAEPGSPARLSRRRACFPCFPCTSH